MECRESVPNTGRVMLCLWAYLPFFCGFVVVAGAPLPLAGCCLVLLPVDF